MKTLKLNLIISFMAGICVAIVGKKICHSDRNVEKQDKLAANYDVLNNWMYLKENNETVGKRLQQRGIKIVSIYGMGDIGRHLKKDLEDTGIEVKYAIDRSFMAISDIDVYDPEYDLPKVDAVIVTPVFDYDNVRKKLELRINCPILSIAEIVKKNGG